MDLGARGRGRGRAASHRFSFVVALLAVSLLLPAALVGGAPTREAAAAQLGSSGLYLNKWDCDGTYGHDLTQLVTYCVVTNNVTFDILGPNYQESFQGGFSLSAMPAGQYTIREHIPQGYVEPLAFCGIAASDDQQPPLTEVITYDGYYEFALAENESIYCNWFNVPLTAFIATLYVNKHFCPPLAEFDAYSASRNELAANCQEPPTPVDFTVTQTGAEIAGGTAQGAPDALVFDDLPTGDLTVIEELPEGYGDPIVHCTVKDQFGNDRAPVTDAPVDNDRIFWRFNDGDVVFCSWFNVPAELGTTISVVKYACPDHVDYDWGDYDEYLDDCTEPVEDVSFKLDGASTGNPGEQLTDADGQVTWSEMEADHYFLTEEVPSGYASPVVYCSYYDPAALQTERDWEEYDVSDENRIEFEVADGESIVCVWFNVSEDWAGTSPSGQPTTEPTTRPTPTPDRTPPTGGQTAESGDATLTIRMYLCETGYDYRAEDAAPADDCTDRPDDVEFELATAGGSLGSVSRRADTGEDEPGEATFADVGPGDYQVSEDDFPAGATAFLLTCESDQRDWSDYPVWPFALVAADGSIRLTLVEDETLVCDWYEIPGEGGGGQGLTVQVYTCADDEPSVEACDPATEPVRFVLVPVTGDDEAVEFRTDETGSAHLNDLEGTYTLGQAGQRPCLVESTDLDEDGNLTVSADEESVVLVFNCA